MKVIVKIVPFFKNASPISFLMEVPRVMGAHKLDVGCVSLKGSF